MRNHLALIIVAVVALSTIPGGPAGYADAAIVTPSFTVHVAPSGLRLSGDAAEPTIGVNWNTGAVMYQSWTATYRVRFDDTSSPPTATWSDASSPYSIVNVDPILFTDHVTGRTFAGGLDGACSVLSYSDADGVSGSWTPMGNACAATLDHETIGSGAWRGAKPVTATYDRAVYYCAQASAVSCAVSQDGGVTFGATIPVTCGFANPGFHGSVHVGPTGAVFLPFRTCGSVNGVGVSLDNGFSWASRPIPGANSPDRGFDPDVATTTSGWAYVGYPTSSFGVGAALTKDNGATWTNFGDVAAAAGIKTSTFHEMVAGDDSRAAVVYLGSTTDSNAPHDPGFNGVWHLYVTYTTNAGASWTTVRASDNIVQKGCIWDGGGDHECRNLLDFMDAQIDDRGRIVIGYADGCLATCEAGGTQRSSHATIARQSGGSTVFAAFDPSGPSAPSTPTLSGSAGDTQNSVSWTTPADGGSAITGYKLYRNGALYKTLGLQNSYVDTGLTNGQSYTYRVSAVNAVGEGTQSNSVSLTPFSIDPPSAPQNLQAKHANGPNSGKIKIDWGAPATNGGAAVTNYKVYRGTTTSNIVFLTTVGNVLAYTDSGLTTGTTYYYQVSAVNSEGEGPRSNVANAVG